MDCRFFLYFLTWNKRKAYPLGGKYDLLSALCGQSTTSGPNLLKLTVISSSSMSGGRPPTNTFLENLSPPSEPCEWGEDLEGELNGWVPRVLSTRWLGSSRRTGPAWSSNPEKYGDLPGKITVLYNKEIKIQQKKFKKLLRSILYYLVC